MQGALHVIYPPQCITCDALVTTDFGLCADCWRETPFIGGLVCDKCGAPMLGHDTGKPELCDDCLTIARPWEQGRAALVYKDNARRMVLALKHGDQMELARPAAGWMLRAAAPLLRQDMLLAPMPLHWTRLFKRRYNQSAMLSHLMAQNAALAHCPDLLLRARATPSQEGRSRDARFANMQGAFRPNPRHLDKLIGRHVLLVDDVMTSGASLAAAAEAALAGGAKAVSVVALARVVKDV